MNNPTHNPYAKAAGAYGTNAQKNAPDQRELEARVLLKAAHMLKDLQDNWGQVTTELLDSTLKYNRQIWMMFYDTAIENAEGERPNDLRSNIINLANFVFSREVDILADKERGPEKLNVLININKEIAAGLMTKNKSSQNAPDSSLPSPPSESSAIDT
jgi:flagellar biosynthesis activator protein FlaF